MRAKHVSSNRLFEISKGMRKYGMAAFSKKENAERFAGLLHAKGYKPEGLRTFGPTIEQPHARVKAYTVFRGNKRFKR